MENYFQWNLKRAPVNFFCLFRASLKFGHYLTGGLTKVTFKKENSGKSEGYFDYWRVNKFWTNYTATVDTHPNVIIK